MRIGLLDIDNHSAKKKRGATIFPNIALAKISRYHKMQGDDVEWAQPIFGSYDIIYASKIFNFSPDFNRLEYHADKFILGGTGYDLTSELPEEIDRLQPDFSIYPNVPDDVAYGFLTRGCPNHCKWCVVPRKEGKVRAYMDIEEIAIEGRTNIVLMDNNILALPDYAHEQFDKIIRNGYRVDFNQALDARLVTDEFAKQLAQIRWMGSRIRFGCDTTAQIDHCERAIALINAHGYNGEYILYAMLNDNFTECYNRLMYWWRRNNELKQEHRANIHTYAPPFRDPCNPNRPIPKWQKDMATWASKHQVYQVTDFDNFEPRKGFKCINYKNRLA